MDDDEDFIKEGEKKSKTIRVPSDIWNLIVGQSRKHHCKTSQVIVTILGAYFDANQKNPLLPYQCPSCRKVNETGANYCNDCGTPLNEEAAAELLEMKSYINKFKEDPAVMAEYAEWLKNKKKG